MIICLLDWNGLVNTVFESYKKYFVYLYPVFSGPHNYVALWQIYELQSFCFHVSKLTGLYLRQ